MRRIVALVAAFVAACASIGAPPGGPERTTPPVLKSVEPDSGAVNVRARSVVFTFDEVVSDRGQLGDIDNMFILSPQEGGQRVGWHRDRVEVRPRHNFRPNTAYSVTMLPGITDQRGNVLRTGRVVIFSTGPAIPRFTIQGRVFDWMNERVAQRAWVEAIRLPDSLPYVGPADSAGQFVLGPLDTGRYLVRAIMDNNSNRALDPNEPWDSVTVSVRDTTPFLEMLAAQRDTLPPRLLTITAPDTLTFAASFDRPLDPTMPFTPQTFRVTASDSTPLTVRLVRTRAQETAAQQAVRDSTARADSVKRAATDTSRTPPTAQARPVQARVDTATLNRALTTPVKPSKPAPPKDLVVKLDLSTPLHVGATYRVTAINVRGLTGRTRTSDRVVTVPKAAPPSRSDTTKTARPGAPAAPRPTTRPPDRSRD